ncbi:MAG: alpha/beta hydrolase [Dongiaceae bacterium]
MSNLALSFLSRYWAGLAIAAVMALLGWWAVTSGTIILGYVLIAVATLMAIGGFYHLIYILGVRRRYPPPGRMIDIGGHRVHLLAEGDANGKATVVWLPGGHVGGSHLHHLHDMLRATTRSILIDRPGTGWSDVGPFPRTTLRETTEVVTALEKAGEKPPFLIAGHSFGGLLAANIGRARPDLVSCVALIDATPPETIAFGPRHPALKVMRRTAWVMGLLGVFGIHINPFERRSDPAMRKMGDLIAERLGKHLPPVRAVESAPQTWFAAASIFQELSPEGMARAGWDIVVYDGDLDHVPVLLIAPGDMVELQENLKQLSAGGAEAARVQRFYSRSRERYLATSTQAKRIYAPKGTGHNFPIEAPEFLADVIREAAAVNIQCTSTATSVAQSAQG